MSDLSFVQRTKRLFFSTAIGDIHRAIDGRSLVGAFTLGMCAIGALSYLHYADCDKEKPTTRISLGERCVNCLCRLLGIREVSQSAGIGDARLFRTWVKNWLRKTNNKYKNFDNKLYGVRCGLVHTFGMSESLDTVDVQGFQFVHGIHADHWKEIKDKSTGTRAYRLNLESFVSELVVAAYAFFDNLDERYTSLIDSEAIESTFLHQRLSQLLCQFMVQLAEDEISTCDPPASYGSIHQCLSPLDKKWSDSHDLLTALRQSISENYKEKMILWQPKKPLFGESSVVLTQAATGCSNMYTDWSQVSSSPTITLDVSEPD